MQISSPAGSKRPAACSPPVRSNTPWPDRMRSTSPVSRAGSTTGPAGSSARSRRRSSINTAPHTPHAELASIDRSGLRRGARARWMSTWLESTMDASIVISGAVSPDSALIRMSRTSSRARAMPSANIKPRASSMSSPGVRITTESGRPSSNSCSGSSVTTASGTSLHSPDDHLLIRMPGAGGLANQPSATRRWRAPRGTAVVVAKPRHEVTRSGLSSTTGGTSDASMP